MMAWSTIRLHELNHSLFFSLSQTRKLDDHSSHVWPIFVHSCKYFWFIMLYRVCQVTSISATSALPKSSSFSFLYNTTWLSNRKGVIWTSLGFLNITGPASEKIRAGLHGHSSPGQRLLNLSMRVVEVVCGPTSVGNSGANASTRR